MPLKNYRDLSVGGSDIGSGFQYQFYCSRCERQWKTAFKPFRLGQLTGVFVRFAYLFAAFRTVGRTSGHFAEFGSRTAREKAFGDAQTQAAGRFAKCPACGEELCSDCFDTAQPHCHACRDQPQQQAPTAGPGHAPPVRAGAFCGQCAAALSGGRFCADCGFDTASTQATCTACAMPLAPHARFCTHCGHG